MTEEINWLADFLKTKDAMGSVYVESTYQSFWIKAVVIVDISASPTLDATVINGKPLSNTYYFFNVNDANVGDLILKAWVKNPKTMLDFQFIFEY